MNCPKDGLPTSEYNCGYCPDFCLKDGDKLLIGLRLKAKRRDDLFKLYYLIASPRLIRPFYEWIEYGRINVN